MKNKQLVGFLIISICLLILLGLIFFTGYLLHESKKDKLNTKNDIKVFDNSLIDIEQTYQQVEADSTIPKESKQNGNNNCIHNECDFINKKLPDLETSITKTPDDGEGNIVLEAIIKNGGDIEAINIEWKIISMNDQQFTDLGDEHTTSIIPGNEIIITYKFKPKECPITVGFLVDPENKIEEKKESNNHVSIDIIGCYKKKKKIKIPLDKIKLVWEKMMINKVKK